MPNRTWSQETAVIDGKEIRSFDRYTKYCHIYVRGRGDKKRVATFVAEGYAKFLVKAANAEEARKGQ